MSMNTPPAAGPMPVQRYHPAQVALHWAIAVLIGLAALLALLQGERVRRLLGPGVAGVPILGIHMIVGIIVLILLAVRLVMRWRIHPPVWATAGSALLDKIGQLTYIGLYILAFAVTVTGLILALQTNRLATAFTPGRFPGGEFRPGQFQPGQLPPGQSPPGGFQPGQQRPGGFEGDSERGGEFFLSVFHGLSWTLLLLLILLHIGAALYHQFFRKDNLLSRMWFGRTT
jgi:cytochrome b561